MLSPLRQCWTVVMPGNTGYCVHGAMRFTTNLKNLLLLFGCSGWIVGLIHCFHLELHSSKQYGKLVFASRTYSYFLPRKSVLNLDKQRASKYAACSWNQFQSCLNLRELVSLDAFKRILNDLEAGTSGSRCFALICICFMSVTV